MEESLLLEPSQLEPAPSTQSLSEQNLSLLNAGTTLGHDEEWPERFGDLPLEAPQSSVIFRGHVTLADCMFGRANIVGGVIDCNSRRFRTSSHSSSISCAADDDTETITEPTMVSGLTEQDRYDNCAWADWRGTVSFPGPLSFSPGPPSRTAPNIESENHSEVTPGKERSRKGLPLIFKVASGHEKVMTGHDTGTHANHMSLELAEKLGYSIDRTEIERGQFQLPTGKIIESIGRVTAQVQFAQGEDCETSTHTCYFNVFSTLAVPALIGMAFLNATATLTTYTSRLATLPAGWKRSLRLCAVGNATNEVTCVLNGMQIRATADTGAEIALVSGDFAMRNGLLRQYSCEELELADGSREYTSGFGDLTLAIRNPDSGKFMTKTVRFHVLKHLQFDVILDEDIIEDFNMFQRGISSVLQLASDMAASLGPIAHLRTLEQSVANTKEKVKEWASSIRLSRSVTQTTLRDPPPLDNQSLRFRKLAELEGKLQALDQTELQRRAELRKKTSFTIAEAEHHTRKQARYRAERQVLVDDRQALLTS